VGFTGSTEEVEYANDSATTLALAPLLAKHNEPAKRLDDAAAVFSETTPDKGIPQEMLANAHCIVIVPGLKTGAREFWPSPKTVNPCLVNVRSGLAVTALRAVEREIQ
jgi:hypothetical protein